MKRAGGAHPTGVKPSMYPSATGSVYPPLFNWYCLHDPIPLPETTREAQAGLRAPHLSYDC
jgi:hypothetical protein